MSSSPGCSSSSRAPAPPLPAIDDNEELDWRKVQHQDSGDENAPDDSGLSSSEPDDAAENPPDEAAVRSPSYSLSCFEAFRSFIKPVKPAKPCTRKCGTQVSLADTFTTHMLTKKRFHHFLSASSKILFPNNQNRRSPWSASSQILTKTNLSMGSRGAI